MIAKEFKVSFLRLCGIPEKYVAPITCRSSQGLKESIRLDGIKTPIIIELYHTRVFDGIHRLTAAKELGLTLIPVIYMTGIEFDKFVGGTLKPIYVRG